MSPKTKQDWSIVAFEADLEFQQFLFFLLDNLRIKI
jgi:hypothetical protein